MEFDWDAAKADSNLAKHGIGSFQHGGHETMSEESIIRYTAEELERLPSRTDGARLDALTDEEIEAAIADDPDAAPILDAEFFRTARLVMPPGAKTRITMNVDDEVLEFFRAKGRGYQTRINAVLRAYVRSRKRKTS